MGGQLPVQAGVGHTRSVGAGVVGGGSERGPLVETFLEGHDQFGFVLHLLLGDVELFLEGPELAVLVCGAVVQLLVLPGQAELCLLQLLYFLLLLLYYFPPLPQLLLLPRNLLKQLRVDGRYLAAFPL